jgi:1-acyl-sn-glycerol-3-phosphate acyltransferase
MEEKAALLLKMIHELAVELHPRRPLKRPVTLDSTLGRDLGLDSLARVELLARIERHFRVTIPERIFADAETPRDLLRAVLGASPSEARAADMEIRVEDLGEALPAPHTARTFVDIVEWHVQRHPERPHVRFYSDEGEGDDLTYRQLHEGARALAAGLQRRGLRPGEPVVIMLATGPDYFFSFLGILMAGGIPVPIYPPARKSQIEDHLIRHGAILRNCGASIMIIIPEAKRFAQVLKSQADHLKELVTVTELSAAPDAYVKPKLGGRDIAFLQYTSGSTGNPKGVVLTHANLLANIRAIGDVVDFSPADVVVSWLPLYHDMGLIGAWMCSLYYAAPLVLMSPLSFLARPERWLRAIHRYRGTLTAAPNFAYELCLKRLKEEDLRGLDLSSLRGACNGAEAVSPDTVERFCAALSPCGFRREALLPVYGMAECAVALSFPPLDRGALIDIIRREPFLSDGEALPADPSDSKVLRFVACGRPLPGHEVRIVDAAGRELPERREGRLQFRGPSTTSGYFRNPGDTERLFEGDWLNSGDMAYIAGGDLYITGRTKDIIIRAGRNIYPQELEEAVSGIPSIRKGGVAVFGCTEPLSGTERLVVLAETREEDPEKSDALRSEINALAMDLTGTPADDVVLVPPGTVLKTSSGKIRRTANRELYERDQIGKTGGAVWWQVTRVALAGWLPEMRRMRRAAAAGLYASYCWALFGLVAPFAWLTVVLLPGASRRWTFMRGVARFLARASFTPLLVTGSENLPRGRPCVVVSNHASYIDSYVLVAAVPLELSFVAKGELAASRINRLFLKRIQAEFVERFDKQKGIDDARRIAAAARKGRSPMFFAEGTFTRVPGLLPFHMGAFLAAAEAGIPVVPVAIRGTRSILLDDTWFPRRGAITVTIGRPLEPEGTDGGSASDLWKSALKLRDAAREHILRYCGEPDLSHEKPPI